MIHSFSTEITNKISVHIGLWKRGEFYQLDFMREGYGMAIEVTEQRYTDKVQAMNEFARRVALAMAEQQGVTLDTITQFVEA